MSDIVQTVNAFFIKETWIGKTAEPVKTAVNTFFGKAGHTGRQIQNFLNGTWLGHPLHPVLTDIPIGAWTAAIALNSIEASTGQKGIGKAADTAIAIGVAGAAGSAVSGIADWQFTYEESLRTGFVHGLLNTVALGLFIGSMVARSSHNRSMGRFLALTGFTIASASAYLGGDLVYRQRVGVDHAPERTTLDTDGFVAVLPSDQLPEKKLTKAMLNDTPLVLYREGESVYALANTCAHMGGPLNEGHMHTEEGHPKVDCPWHDSRFDMVNGDVINGPSAFPQPCFDARIRDGQVEVRHQSAQ